MLNHTSTFWSKVALVLSTAGWGIATVISKTALQDLPPITLLVTQLTVSVIFLWTLLLIQRRPLAWDRRWLTVGLLGWLNPGLAYTFSLLGLAHTTASMSTLLWATEPILILGLAYLLLRERLTPKLIALSLLAVIGVLLVAGLGLDVGAASSGWGNALILAGVACCAVYTIFARRVGADLDALALVALQQTCALIWALIIWPIEVRLVEVDVWHVIPAHTWGWAIASGVIYYALAFWFYLIGLSRLPASQASIFLNLIPVFGVSAAFLWLGERLSPPQLFGAGLILVATVGLFSPASRPSTDAGPVGPV